MDTNIILPFEFFSSGNLEMHLDEQDLKSSMLFCNEQMLLDGKEFAERATAELKNGSIIEIGNTVFSSAIFVNRVTNVSVNGWRSVNYTNQGRGV